MNKKVGSGLFQGLPLTHKNRVCVVRAKLLDSIVRVYIEQVTLEPIRGQSRCGCYVPDFPFKSLASKLRPLHMKLVNSSFRKACYINNKELTPSH